MRKFILGIIVGFLLGAVVVAIADGTYLSEQTIWNLIYDSSASTIRIVVP